MLRETYLQMIKNSPKSRLFRNLFVTDGKGGKRDVLENGRESCAFFVSSILKVFSLVDFPHATVNATLKDMAKNGWRETKKLEPGNVLLWEEKNGHRHLGFFIGGKKAVSNAFFYYKSRAPKIHHFTYMETGEKQPRRKIEAMFVHPDIK